MIMFDNPDDRNYVGLFEFQYINVEIQLDYKQHDYNVIDFKIFDKNFHYNKQKQKIAKALWTKDLRPTLDTQEKSIQLNFLIDSDDR